MPKHAEDEPMGSGPESVQLRPTLGSETTEDYDPHQHRVLPNPTNNWETLVHLVKCSLGTGILAMPQAYAKAGLVTGIIGTIGAGIIVTHCLHILVLSQYETCKRRRVPLLTYPEAMCACLESGPKGVRRFGHCSAITVDVFLVTYQLGICCVYIVFIANNLQKVLLPYWDLSVVTYMAVLLVPLVSFNLIPNLKMLAPFSALANVLTLVGISIVVYYLIDGEPTRDATKENLDLWGSPTSFPLFFGTILFALTAVGVVIALENNMATPKAFGKPFGVLNTGMSLIVVLYVGMGALGYRYCGAECKDSITLDLPAGGLTTTVIVMFVVAIFISYVLHCYVPVSVVWSYLRPRLPADATPRALRCAEMILRVVLCLLTFILAAAVPRLGLFISLFGAFCLSALGLCFPAIMEACLKYPHRRLRALLLLLKDVFLFLIGLVGLVAGTYSALKAIVLSFKPTTP